MSRVVGIDLGTTNSLVAFVKDGVPVVIRDGSGDALLPSIVSAAADGSLLVGREAEKRLVIDAGRTVYSVKRFMGRGIDDLKDDLAYLPFRVSGGDVLRVGLGDFDVCNAPEDSVMVWMHLRDGRSLSEGNASS